MYRLNTLGNLHLAESSGQLVRLARARPLGLLVYLACQPPDRLVRRDRLLALFWPELDTDRARHSLRQAVYALRQGLGADSIRSRGEEELGVDADRIWCDARESVTAASRGDDESVVALYRGEFLPGYHLRGAAGEFEEWVERQRRELRNAVVAAGWRLAYRAESAGNPLRAAEFARNAAAAAPLEEAAQRQLMTLLARLGDHAGALMTYDQLVARLRQEFDMAPDAETEKVAARLGRPIQPVPSAPSREPQSPTPSIPTQVTGRRPSVRRAALLAAVAVIGVVTLLLGHATRSARPPIVAVGRIDEVGAVDSAVPLAVLSDLLATSLARIPQLQVLSGPRLIELEEGLGASPDRSLAELRAARAGGATVLIQGRERNSAGSRQLELQLIDLPTGRIVGSLQTGAADLFALADSATAVIAARFGAASPRQGIATVTATSLVAYRLYTEGLRTFYRGDPAAADQLFVAALGEDSAFAMAAYFAYRAAMERTAFVHADSMLRRSVALAARATERERLLILGAWALYRLDPQANAIADSFVSRFPTDPDAHLLLAHSLPGDPDASIRAASEVLRLDSSVTGGETGQCRACDAFEIIVYANQSRDSFPAAERTAREYVRRYPGLARAHWTFGAVLDRLDRLEEARRQQSITDSLLGQPPRIDVELAIRAGQFAAADQELERQLASAEPDRRTEAVWWYTISLRTQGRLAAAAQLQEHGRSPGGARVGTLPAPDSVQLAQVWCEAGGGQAGAALFHRIADRGGLNPDPFHGAKQQSWHLAHTATCLALAGDTARLAALADTLETIGARSPWIRDQRLHHYVRGLLLGARRNWAGAVEAYREAMTSPVEGFTRINYDLADALLRSARPDEAIPLLQSARRGPLEGGGLYLTRTELEERLAQSFAMAGQTDSARVHYQWVERAWRNADPFFRGRWQAAREYLARR